MAHRDAAASANADAPPSTTADDETAGWRSTLLTTELTQPVFRENWTDSPVDSEETEAEYGFETAILPAASQDTDAGAGANSLAAPPNADAAPFRNPTATFLALPDSPAPPLLADTDGDGIAGTMEAAGPNGGDGNRDGMPDAVQRGVATLRASNGEFVTLDATGHQLADVRPGLAPAADAALLPFGLFRFNVHNVTPGGAATVRMILPDDAKPTGYFKQNPANGALERFDFDGTTGATIDGNIVTLHLVDGGRGDADGKANGVIVDPGGPTTTPFVALLAIDPTAAKFKVDAITGTSTGAFGVFRAGDVSEALTVYYTLDSASTAQAGQDYQALSGSVTIAAGRHSAGIIVRPLDNAAGSSSKSVRIALAESPDYLVVDPQPAEVVINESTNIHPEQIAPMGDRPSIGIATLDANAAELPVESSTGLHLIYRSALVTDPIPGPGTTWTNPAAVTANYTVGGAASPGLDYDPLSGQAPLPYAVYAAPVWINPIDDADVEGAEDVTITLQPDPTYYLIPPETATVTIYDDEAPPLAPITEDDEYAMDVEDESLVVSAADGVLFNDAFFSPGPYFLELQTGPQSGSLTFNTQNGSFTYTPNSAIRGTGGDDTFEYVAVQNGLTSVTSVVLIHIVRVTLTTPGLPQAQNMTVGAFVPVNANNHNGSAVTNEIPARRDFDVAPLVNAQNQPINDPDLIQANVAVNPNAGLPGFFTLTVTNNLNSVGRVRLWREQNKTNRAEGVYTLATLPRTFFIEGIEPGAALRENVITVQYTYVGANGLPLSAAADRLAATVTPVIDFFNIITQNAQGVVFRRLEVRPGVFENVGLDTIGANNNGGAIFDAQVLRRGLVGNLDFVQNVMNLLNGTRGAANGYTFAVPMGVHPIPNRNWIVVPVWYRAAPALPFPWVIEENAMGAYVPVQPAGAPADPAAAFPLLDMSQYELPELPAGAPAGPYYRGQFRYLNSPADTQYATAQDSPGTLIPFYPENANVPAAFRAQSQHPALTNIDMEIQFRMFLVWRFADGTRYTISTRDWNVIFRATGPGGLVGLNAIDPRSGVRSPNAFVRNHDNPAVVRPTFNFAVENRPVTRRPEGLR